MQITKSFNIAEFQSKDGSSMPRNIKMNVMVLAENLQVLRDYFGQPIHINSGYRSPYYNDVELPKRGYKTAKNSYHKKGMAADIVVKHKSPKQVARAIKKLIKQGKMKQGGIGLYNGFVHYDIRGFKARWDYSSLFNF